MLPLSSSGAFDSSFMMGLFGYKVSSNGMKDRTTGTEKVFAISLLENVAVKRTRLKSLSAP